ncbi:uncharacterized protein [Atheta coriaria]|uniref:uncharacterized protein n=1 Tax=Dalotia coriaria TaxID=877792 RepID=UPI0031F4649F
MSAQQAKDFLDRLDTVETNVYILSAVFGATCAILLVIVAVFGHMIYQLRSKANKGQIGGPAPFLGGPVESERPDLNRNPSLYSAPMPRIQSLTADNLRHQDAQWNNGGHSLPHVGNRNNFRPPTANVDRPFPLSQRPGNPGAAYNNNVGY